MPTDLTVSEAAAAIGVSRSLVHAYIQAGRLKAEKRGIQFFIRLDDLKKLKRPKPGRPPKPRKGGGR